LQNLVTSFVKKDTNLTQNLSYQMMSIKCNRYMEVIDIENVQ